MGPPSPAAAGLHGGFAAAPGVGQEDHFLKSQPQEQPCLPSAERLLPVSMCSCHLAVGSGLGRLRRTQACCAVSRPLQGSPFILELETSRVSAPSFAFGFWRLEVWLLHGASVFWGTLRDW